jgi:hypothetical protein
LFPQEVTTTIEIFKTEIQRLSPHVAKTTLSTRSQDNLVTAIMQSLYAGQARV